MFHKLPSDMKDLVHQHRAAMVIQRFFRNSLYYVETVDNDSNHVWPYPYAGRMKHPRHHEHRSGKFTQERMHRHLSNRCKPLHLCLTRMMREVLGEKKYMVNMKRRNPKRKNLHFKVMLMRRFKALGEGVPIIVVTHETKF